MNKSSIHAVQMKISHLSGVDSYGGVCYWIIIPGG